MSPRNDCLTRYSKHRGPFRSTIAYGIVICDACGRSTPANAMGTVGPLAKPTTYPDRIGPETRAAMEVEPDPVAVARNTDPGTSHAAAASVEQIRESQRRVYDLLASPKCDEEIIATARDAGVQMTDSGIRTRRSELVDKGLVRDSGKRRKTAANRLTIVWERAPV